jgi:hypothetical protein
MRKKITIMIAVASVLLFAALNMTIVGTALPKIVSKIGGMDYFDWVFTIYMLTSSITAILVGKLSDIFGRKIFFLESDTIQNAFSEGRLQVTLQDENSRKHILSNTMREQQLMVEDPDLRQDFLMFNAELNRLLTEHPEGLEQLQNSTLKVMDKIVEDDEKNRHMIKNNLESRQYGLENKEVRKQLLHQNIQEQKMILKEPDVAKELKRFTLDTNEALMKDPEFSREMLEQNIKAFHEIAKDPDLRSKMADAMLLLMKDPKIQKELEKMIKMVVQQEMQKLKQAVSYHS